MTAKSMMPLAAALGLCLGACTDEPSESAMRDAANNLLRQQAQLLRMGSSRGDATQGPAFTSFRKIGCEPALPSLGGYNCGYEASINNSPAVQGRGRFYKNADGTLAMIEGSR